MQRSFAFSLYLFDKFGEDWRPVSFYENAFENAFPQLAEANKEIVFGDQTVKFDSKFIKCNVAKFGDYFGFLEARRSPALALHENPSDKDLLLSREGSKSTKTCGCAIVR